MDIENGPRDEADAQAASPKVTKEAWEAPAIESFAPVKSAHGISYRPGDGISNLS